MGKKVEIEVEVVEEEKPAKDRTLRDLAGVMIRYALKRKHDKPLGLVLLLFFVEKMYRSWERAC
jgi:hypothetical protein